MRCFVFLLLPLLLTCKTNQNTLVADVSPTLPLPLTWNFPLDIIPEVPEVSLDYSPDYREYQIRTRVTIERIKERLNENDVLVLLAATERNVREELSLAENIFSETCIKFHVVSITIAEPADYRDWQKDAERYPDYMSIYYMLPTSNSWFEGLSCFPGSNRGILISTVHAPTTLAHEIGHYFGLRHVFDSIFARGDGVQDTEEQLWAFCDGFVNHLNVMNYCDHHGEHFITQGQVDRMMYFLYEYRWGLVMQPQVKTQNIFQTFIGPLYNEQ